MDGFAVLRGIAGAIIAEIIMLCLPVTTLIASLGLSWAPTTTWVNRLTPANFWQDQADAETCAGRRRGVKTHGGHSDRRGFWDGQLIDLTGAVSGLLLILRKLW